ncbi:MAG TPA: GNAT family N-acetyltransferase [Usitatibacter sp.]|nr:GNAT family N-acetyltransferase [Usitatibacter sp.]
MGSIQAFPRKPGVATLADVWRTAQLSDVGAMRVREARLEDFAALRALQKHAAPFSPPLTLRALESRRLAFPAGQWVAINEGRVAGFASCLLLARHDYGDGIAWAELTGEGFFTTHHDDAHTLFCADLFVDPTPAGANAMKALVHAMRKACRRMNLRRVLGTERLAGYGECESLMTPEAYAMRIIAGDIPEEPLRARLAQGYQFGGVLRGFAPEDAPSRGHAALLVWLNPLHAPAGPPAFALSSRARKCA